MVFIVFAFNYIFHSSQIDLLIDWIVKNRNIKTIFDVEITNFKLEWLDNCFISLHFL